MCFREGVGAFLFDGVLGGHHQKQFGKRIRLATNTDLSLCHGFQQRRLYFGRRTVDFVCQHQVIKNRPVLEFEGTGLGPEDIGPRNVAGKEVRSELNAVETAFNAHCHFFDGACFSQAGCTLHKEVPVGQQRQHEFVYQVLLANDLLPQPAFKVRKELVVHGSSLCYCCVRNGDFSDHYKALTFKKTALAVPSRGDGSESRQFIACQGVCEALAPIVSTFFPAFEPLDSGQARQKRAVFF